jgi:hypothetical protein
MPIFRRNKEPVTAFGVSFWFCWMWLVAVVGRCLEGSEVVFSLHTLLTMQGHRNLKHENVGFLHILYLFIYMVI